jgi:hypothetical protein
MFSLGMVIHFMAFRGKLPYSTIGDTVETLASLRREVESYPGFHVTYLYLTTGTLKMTVDMISPMNYTNSLDFYSLVKPINDHHVKKSST